MGYQTIAPGCRVREHSHGDQIELQICFRGRGRVVVDGVSHPLVPGTACFLGYDVKHEIINDSPDEDLVMLWVITPPGLEDFFKAIGRPRSRAIRRRRRSRRPGRGGDRARMGMNDTEVDGSRHAARLDRRRRDLLRGVRAGRAADAGARPLRAGHRSGARRSRTSRATSGSSSTTTAAPAAAPTRASRTRSSRWPATPSADGRAGHRGARTSSATPPAAPSARCSRIDHPRRLKSLVLCATWAGPDPTSAACSSRARSCCSPRVRGYLRASGGPAAPAGLDQRERRRPSPRRCAADRGPAAPRR